jgi:hypothetical protein
MKKYLPQFFPKPWEAECDVLGMSFTEDVSIGFVLRENGGYSYLLKADEVHNAIDSKMLLKEAISNLAELSIGAELKIAWPPGAVVAWINANDNFAAIRILVPKVVNILKQELGNSFYFTIPSRDLVLCWNKSAPQSITNTHLDEAAEDFQTEEYNLSPHGFIYDELWPFKRIR